MAALRKKLAMNMVFKKLSISFLLLVGMASAFANPDKRQEERAAARLARQQSKEMRHNEQQMRHQDDRYPGRESAMRDGGAQGFQPGPDNARKPGKLSPEERRALRRQINEAGQDIYTPKRF